jgi:hypothetical protein
MTDLLKLILCFLASLFKSRATLEAEILVLRQQINVLRRGVPKGPQLNNTDRILFVWLYRWFPSILGAIAIVRPETIIRWHRAGFRTYWRWRFRNRIGRPKVSAELRRLIGEISSPRAKLGFVMYEACALTTRHLSVRVRVFIDFLVEPFGGRPYWDLVD